MELLARVTFTSDWRVGTGAGVPGGVDGAVYRDEDDLPAVPGKSLTGVWRDACEVVAAGLDGGPAGPWSDRVLLLFGDQPAVRRPGQSSGRRPRPARLSVRPARLPDGVRAALAEPARRPLRDALISVRSGVALDQAAVARPDMLRFHEVATADLVLTSPVALHADDLPGPERDRLLALLLAGAACIERLGAGRRRGLGRCGLVVERADGTAIMSDEALREHLQSTESAVPGSAQGASPTPTPAAVHDSSSPEQPALRLRLSADTPLLLQPTVTGNVVRTEDVIPGGFLLPIVMGAVDRVLGPGRASTALQSGELRVGAGLPEVNGDAGRPVPFALVRPKSRSGLREEHSALNRFAESDRVAERSVKEPTKPIREGWIGPVVGGSLPPFRTIKRAERLHAVVDDADQRPIDAGLFVYDVVDTGERFSAVVRVRGLLADELAGRQDDLIHKLPSRAAVGRSKKDDYGAVTLKVEGYAVDDERERLRDLNAGDTFTVWLQSDLLCTDRFDRPDTTAAGLLVSLRNALIGAGAAPDLRLTIAGAAGSGSPLMALRVSRREGWQAAWGLPRPSLIGHAAGSCAVVSIEQGTVPAAALATVEAWGVGQRTPEGLGAVRFDDPLLSSALYDAKPAREDDVNDPPSTANRDVDVDVDLGKIVEDRCWRREIARAAVVAAPEHISAVTGVSPSQQARLREAAAAPDGAARGIRRWHGDRRLDGLGWKQAQRDEILAWTEPWAALNVPGLADLTVVRSPEELREAHQDFALRALVDAVLRSARTAGKSND